LDDTLEGIEALALECVEALPQAFKAAAQSVLIRVEDLPDKHLLDDLGIEDPLELTGLYDGVPVTEKVPSDPDPFPDIITLFREPILAELEEREGISLKELVHHVVVHEFAHHFGWSDADIARVDRWWE
jgi:predicted Zn-dependent protease with MMP-like domain